MTLSIPVLAAVGVAFLVLLLLALRRRDRARDLVAPPRISTPAPPPRAAPRAWPEGAAPIGDVPPDVAAEVRALLGENRKIEAIKIARAATGLSLADAKELVDRIEG
ncbi:MAG: large subunit ribosomal protein [Sphingomonadales bacterium]|jgi:hypothetical protein|nr:large subunit ribosomal protein [Sphingomonadales bacterium]